MYRFFKTLVDLAYWYEVHTTNRFGNRLVLMVESATPGKHLERMCAEKIQRSIDARWGVGYCTV